MVLWPRTQQSLRDVGSLWERACPAKRPALTNIKPPWPTCPPAGNDDTEPYNSG